MSVQSFTFLEAAVAVGFLTPGQAKQTSNILNDRRQSGGDPSAAQLCLDLGLLTERECRDVTAVMLGEIPAQSIERRSPSAMTASGSIRDEGFTPHAGPSVSLQLGVREPVTLQTEGRPAPPPMPSEGPKYLPGDLLGRGGMGEVRLHVDRDLRREVAIKTLRKAEDRIAVQRFVEEAQITGQLEHPNIVPVHELGLDPKSRAPFLVMKRVRGRSVADVIDDLRNGRPTGLDDALATRTGTSTHSGFATESRSASRIRANDSTTSASGRHTRTRVGRAHAIATPVPEIEGPPESPQQALTRLLHVFLKVCDAMAYAHASGVIHRDLKPENVMVGRFGEVLVMDWGMAKVIGRTDAAEGESVATVRGDASQNDDGPADVTIEGTVKGTPAYMSPEQAMGEIDKLDERSDVYALGCVLYEMLTLEPAFTGGTVYSVISKVAQGDFVAPRERQAMTPWAVPRELEAVVMKAMQTRRASRYQNVLELKADIEAYFAGRTLAAADYSSWQLATKWLQRNKAMAVGVVATLLALLAGAVGISVSVAEASAREQVLQAEKQAEALEAAEEARVATEGELDRDARRKADAHWRDGNDLMANADALVWNPAAPQDWLQAHMLALLEMGKALQAHPDASDVWKEGVADGALRVQQRAQEISDWALARVVADSAAVWHAIDDVEHAARLDGVARAREAASRADRDRLLDLLQRVADAQDPDDSHGELIPGELDERVRMVASGLSGPEVLEATLVLLEGMAYVLPDGETIASPAPNTLARLALIDLLGRLGDPHTVGRSMTAVQLSEATLTAIANGLAKSSDEEVNAWIMAAARIAARFPNAMPDVDDAFTLVGRRITKGPVPITLQRAREYLHVTLDGGAFPSQKDNREAFTRQISDVAEWAAGKVTSGRDYTATLLDTATHADEIIEVSDGDAADDEPDRVYRYSHQQLAFVFDQLGLTGDALPPTATEPEVAAVPVLREALYGLRTEWVGNVDPAEDELREWVRQRNRAFAAAANLSRLQASATAEEIYERRVLSGEYSQYWLRTRLAFAMLPLDAWPQPVRAEDFVRRGNAHRAQGNYQAAIDDYSRAIDLDRNLADAYHQRGLARHDQWNLREAIADFTMAIDLEPTAEGYLHRGYAHHRDNAYELARADYLRALAVRPNYALAYNHLGRVHYKNDEYEEAVEDYSRAIDLDPNLAWAYRNRGSAYRKLDEYEKAIADYNEAIRLAPTYADAYNSRGLTKRRMGDLEGAIADYTDAIRLDPTSPATVYGNRGYVRNKVGDTEGAMRDYEVKRQFRGVASADPRGLPSAPAKLVCGEFAGELAIGDRRMRGGEYIDTYTFKGERGQRVRLSMRANLFDSYLVLEFPDGEGVYNDDANSFKDAELTLTLQQTGVYIVYCTSHEADELGEYVLTVELD